MSIPVKQLSPYPLDPNGDRVMSFPEFCQVAGFSIATLRRLIQAGTGPVVTRLSVRRLGIRVRHGREWLDARTEHGATA
jgi:predicted DNA-binding transcriptional regulator AlpA